MLPGAELTADLLQVIVADSEKENIGHQSLRNRQSAGQAKANLVLATEQSAVNIAHLEAKISEGALVAARLPCADDGDWITCSYCQ